MTLRTAMKVLDNMYWLTYSIDTISKAMKKVGVSIEQTGDGHMIRHTPTMNKIEKPTIVSEDYYKDAKKVELISLMDIGNNQCIALVKEV